MYLKFSINLATCTNPINVEQKCGVHFLKLASGEILQRMTPLSSATNRKSWAIAYFLAVHLCDS